jgi:lysophospholipase L1-like esterase
MAIFSKLARYIWRDWSTDGIPSSGPNMVLKSDVRTWGSEIEAYLNDVGTNLTASATSAATALIASQEASAQAVISTAQAAAALAAASASGAPTFFDTYALAVANITPLAANQLIEVQIDETRNGARTRYRKNGSVYDFKFAFSLATPAAISSSVVGKGTPTVAGVVIMNQSVYFTLSSLTTYDQFVTSIDTYCNNTGFISLVVGRVNSGNTITFVSKTPIAVNSLSSTTPVGVYVPAGCVIGVLQSSANLNYSSTVVDNTMVFTAFEPTANTAYTVNTSLSISIKYALSGDIKGRAELAYTATSTIEKRYGITQNIGVPSGSVVGTGGVAWGGYTVTRPTAILYDGFATAIEIALSSATTLEICAISVNASGQIKKERSITVPAAAGVNNIAIKLAVLAGEYIGIRSLASNYIFQFSSNPDALPIWYYTGGDLPTVYTTVTSTSSHRMEWRVTIQNGILGRTSILENAKLKIMDSADNTGVSDVTALLASARSASTSVYLPSGLFNVTSVPAAGGGIWGEGKLKLNGKRFFTSEYPVRSSLLTRFRSALSTQISTKSCLVLIGDSKSHFAYASIGFTHWFNLLTAFANILVSPNDEPVMTALRPSGVYTPAFYGVTTAGPITTGTAGPISESAILAAGASLTFTGTYEQIDVCYTQQVGAGSLTFAFNGTVYKTVTCAGVTELDRFSGPSLTGQTVSGTYTITATGGSVELTALYRLGVKVVGSPNRLLTHKAARGSYALSSFGAVQVASIVKQAAVFGGTKPAVIIALSINDILGGAAGSGSAIQSRLQTLIDLLQSAGVVRIIVELPFRPIGQSSTILTLFDQTIGLLYDTVFTENLLVVYEDDIDWGGEGMTGDNIHLNDTGHDLLAQNNIMRIIGQ